MIIYPNSKIYKTNDKQAVYYVASRISVSEILQYISDNLTKKGFILYEGPFINKSFYNIEWRNSNNYFVSCHIIANLKDDNNTNRFSDHIVNIEINYQTPERTKLYLINDNIHSYFDIINNKLNNFIPANHFPKNVSEHLKILKFSFKPKFLQGSGYLQARFNSNKDYLQSLKIKSTKQSTIMISGGHKKYTVSQDSLKNVTFYTSDNEGRLNRLDYKG